MIYGRYDYSAVIRFHSPPGNERESQWNIGALIYALKTFGNKIFYLKVLVYGEWISEEKGSSASTVDIEVVSYYQLISKKGSHWTHPSKSREKTSKFRSQTSAETH